MSFARKTYDTDSIVLRTVIARTSTDQNISSGKVLVAQGDGSTAWMYPSTLPGIPAFTRVIGNGTEIVADNLSSALVLSTTDSMGMLTNSTTKEIRFYAKAFTTIDISGDNSVSAFNTTTNTLTPTVELVGAGGIQISSDPQTNQIFFQTVVPAISTGIYGYHQVNVLSNAPSTITDDNFSTNNTYLTATSPSTVLQLAGLGDIILQTDTTNQVTYIGISTFTTTSFQAVSTAAGLTQTTGSTLSTTIGLNTSSLWFSTNTAMNSTNTQFQANFNYINNFYTPLNDYQDLSTFVQSSFANTVGLSSFSTLEASIFTATNISISSALISSLTVKKEVVSTLEVSSATVKHAEISTLVVSSLTGIDFGGDFSTTLLYIQGPSNVAVGAEELRYIQGVSTLVIGDNVSTNYITVNAKDKSFNAISEFVHPFLELGYYPHGDTNYSNVQMNDNSLVMYSDNPASEFGIVAENLRLQCANGTLQLWASSTQLLTSMYPQMPDSFDLGSSISRFREFYVSSMWAQNATLENVNISVGLNTANISTGIILAEDTLNVFAPSTVFAGDIAAGTIHATGDILPTLSSTFDLGSSELPWRDLYLSAASLYLSTTRVSLDATGNLTVKIGSAPAYRVGTTNVPVSSFASTFTNVANVSSLIASSITAVNFIYLSSVQDSFYISTVNLDAQEVTFSTSLGAVTSTASLLASSVNGIRGSDLISTGQLTSSITGLGTAGYISSAQLTSTVTGLGTAGYVSSTQLTSSVTGLGTAGYVSSSQLTSSITGLGNVGYISSAQLTSTVTGIQRNLGVSSLAVSSLTQVGTGTISSLTVSTIAQVGTATFSTLAVSSFGFTTLATSSFTVSSLQSMTSNVLALNAYVTARNLTQRDLWIAVGDSGGGVATIKYSGNNGSNWSNSASGGFSGSGRDVAYNGNVWVAVGSGSSQSSNILYSTDGSNWSTTTNGGASGGGLCVAWNGRIWVAGFLFANTTTSIQWSSNGFQWSNVTANNFNLYMHDVGWNGRMWVGVGSVSNVATFSSATIQYSFDGLTWSNSATNAFTQDGYAIAWNGRYWLAGGSNTGNSNGTIKYSTDGSNWSNSVSGAFATNCQGLAWNGTMWVATGGNGGVTGSLKYSYDGLNWSNAASGGFSSEGRGVKWNGTRFIAVGNSATPASTIQASSDGINWTPQTSGAFSAYPLGIGYSSNVIADLDFDNLEIYGKSQYPYMTSTNEIYMATSSLQINNLTLENFGIGRSNVGVGTTRPDSLLDVAGTLRVGPQSGNTSSFSINLGTSGVGTSRSALIFSDGRDMDISNQQNGNLTMYANNGNCNAYIRIISTGNVGIGNSNPVATLDIIGASLAYSNTHLMNNNFLMGTGRTTGSQLLYMGTFSSATFGHSYIQSHTAGINAAPLFINGRGGNTLLNFQGGSVGIGISSPTYTLDVNGTGRSVSSFYITGQANSTIFLSLGPAPSATNPDYTAQIQSCNDVANNFGSQLSFWTHGNASGNVTRAMTITNAQNVGIGTASPQEKLDVNGQVLVGDTAASKPVIFLATDSNETYIQAGKSYTASSGANLTFSAINGGASPTMLLDMSNRRVGIATRTPSCQFHVNGSTSNASGTHFAAFTGIQNNSAASTLMASMNTSVALMTTVGPTNDIIIYYRAGGVNRFAGFVGSVFFTGQHANVSVDSNLNTSTLTDHVGKIVRSTGKYMSFQNGSTITGKDAIFTTEALPTIELVSKDMDKAVWGVVTNHRNDTYNDDGTPMLDHQSGFGDRIEDRIRINGLGEGAIWITNINGDLENGDYICSSAVPGYGRKQDDDLLHNYTVAKITMDCPFELVQENYVCEEFEWNGSTLRKAYVGCTYHCS